MLLIILIFSIKHSLQWAENGKENFLSTTQADTIKRESSLQMRKEIMLFLPGVNTVVLRLL